MPSLTKQTVSATNSFPPDARLWILSDGKAGNEAQCLGVADALGITPEIKKVATKGVFAALAPYGPIDPRIRFARPGSEFVPPWPHIAIGCGRLTTPYIRRLRRASGLATYTVILLDPKTGANTADLFWVPEHDRRRGANVITSVTSPHRFSPQRLEDLRRNMPASIAALGLPRVAVLIGGPNGDYAFSDEDVGRLVSILRELSQSGAGLMITCSRRTPAALVAGIEEATAGTSRIFWAPGAGENPYPDFLAHADAFIVTADSVNMTGEAAASGRPVHVFQPSGGSAKFDRFHALLAQTGATRRLLQAVQVLQSWDYVPLYSATAIADEIRRRYAKRATMLGSLIDRARDHGHAR